VQLARSWAIQYEQTVVGEYHDGARGTGSSH
jgi:hypothetical protein